MIYVYDVFEPWVTKLDTDGWTPGQATTEIRTIANSTDFTISYKRHATDQMSERGLIMSDVLHVLKYGFVYSDPIPSTREGYHKYAMENKVPNGGNREVRVIVIPDKLSCELKIVTVMWVDHT